MNFCNFLTLLAVFALSAFAQKPAPKPAPGAMIYVGALPGQVLMIDEAQEKVVDRIPLQTGVARNLAPSFDRKKIYVHTARQSGIEVLDLAARKIVNHFILNEGNRTVRLRGVAPDPQDRFLYATFTVAVKQADRFEFEKPKFAVIDLAQKKITKTVDFPKDEDPRFGLRGDYRVSPDGKYLYVFEDNVQIFDTNDFKLVEKIELSKPLYPGMETIRLGLRDDPHDEPGIVTSVFNATDPIVHRSIFGIGRVDLAQRSFDFTPVGPAAAGMMGLQLAPDRKTGYAVVFFGSGGDRRTEFWVFDMGTRKVVKQVEFGGPINFRFSVSGDGRQLYAYGSAPIIECYDTATLKLRKTIEVNADLTTGMVVIPDLGDRQRISR
jgi:hypothetical protein